MKYLLLLTLISYVWVNMPNITQSKQIITPPTVITLVKHLYQQTSLQIPRVAESEAYGK